MPPLPEQKRIAAILDKADALRRLKHEAMNTRARLQRAVFLDLFGDIDSNPKRFPEIELRDVIAETQYGTAKKAGSEGRLPVLRMGNLSYLGQLLTHDMKYMDLEPNEIGRFTVKRGDILFNRTNSPDLVGKTVVYDRDDVMVFAGYLIRVRLTDRALPSYVSSVLNSEYGKQTLRNMCKTIIGMANINAQELRRIQMPLPPLLLQREYERRMKAIDQEGKSQQSMIERFSTLFTSLQHRAFRGELRG